MIFPYSHGRNKASQRSGTIALMLPTRLIHYPYTFKCFLLPTSLSFSSTNYRPVLESLVHRRIIFFSTLYAFLYPHRPSDQICCFDYILAYLNGESPTIALNAKLILVKLNL